MSTFFRLFLNCHSIWQQIVWQDQSGSQQIEARPKDLHRYIRYIGLTGLRQARSGNPGYITGLHKPQASSGLATAAVVLESRHLRPLLVTECLSSVDGSCEQYGETRDATVPGILPGGRAWPCHTHCCQNEMHTVHMI